MPGDLPQRRSIRLPGHDYRGPWTYFVTICTTGRRPILGEIVRGVQVLSSIGRMVEEEWNRTAQIRQEVRLDRYIIMPDHLHGLVTLPSDDEVPERIRLKSLRPGGYCRASLSALVGGFKAACTRRFREITHENTSMWQRNYHERIIRGDGQLDLIREYIRTNPARWEQTM